jgi:hypothetical protein
VIWVFDEKIPDPIGSGEYRHLKSHEVGLIHDRLATFEFHGGVVAVHEYPNVALESPYVL